MGDLWVQHHVRSVKIRVTKMSGLENPSDAQTKYFGPEPLLRHTEAVIGHLSMQDCNRSQKSDEKAYFADDKM